MAAKLNFTAIYEGDTFTERKLVITKGGVPVDLTGATVKMLLKIGANGKLVHTFETSISDPLVGELTLLSWNVDLPASTYDYDLKITLADGSTLTYLVGELKVINSVSWK